LGATYPDTDSLYIKLSEKTSAESQEIIEGVVIDVDSDQTFSFPKRKSLIKKKRRGNYSLGNLVGIDIDNAIEKLNLSELVVKKMPIVFQAISA